MVIYDTMLKEVARVLRERLGLDVPDQEFAFADDAFPYKLYGGQQDNTSVSIASLALGSGSIGESNWTGSAGGEEVFGFFSGAADAFASFFAGFGGSAFFAALRLTSQPSGSVSKMSIAVSSDLTHFFSSALSGMIGRRVRPTGRSSSSIAYLMVAG